MAPPKSPWNKVVSPPPPKNDGRSPGLPPVSKDVKPSQPGSEYVEAQDDELAALRAIYMEDFREVEVKGAWSKHTDRAFKLHLRASSEPSVSVVMSVRLTATYPKTVPLLTLEGMHGLRDRFRKEVESVLQVKPKELLGEVMIFALATAVQDILEEAAQAKEQDDATVSLKEMHANQEAAAVRLAQQQEEEKQQKLLAARVEEERILKQMVDEEVHRRKEAKRKNRQSTTQASNSMDAVNQADNHRILFDQPCTAYDEGNAITFFAVTSATKLRSGPLTEVFTVEPVVPDDTQCPVLVIKRVSLGASLNQEAVLKKAILDFEDEMEALKKLRHPNIIQLLDFKIEKPSKSLADSVDQWQITILTEFANKGSVGEMLDIVQTLPVDKVRSWTVELLEALDYCHRSGVIHKRIHVNNVLLVRSNRGNAVSVKLADSGFQEHLHEVKNLVRGIAKSSSASSAYWTAPELTQDYHLQQTRKTDIWDLGVVFLQMLFGIDVPRKYSSPSALIDSMSLSEALEDFIRRVFRPDAKKRPSAFDLIPSEFLRNDAPVLSRPTSPLRSRMSSSMSLPTGRIPKPRANSMSLGGPFSRYTSEWVEAGRLGKGGYGEVVKARNKLDGRIYAIKKIKQNSSAALTETLSEVMLLSRLNHPYVVRYYTAWPEQDFTDVPETDDETISTAEDVSSVSPHGGPTVDFGHSTGGLDFISSSGYPKIEFGDDNDDDEDDDDEEAMESDSDSEPEENDSSDINRLVPINNGTVNSGQALGLRRTRSNTRPSRPVRSTLYIQMEYCERRTLRDLIRKDLFEEPETAWRLLRQILEGLEHIHGHGIIHRDLKPDNIFIDAASLPRIGDFGLATSGQYQLADKSQSSNEGAAADMTRSIGTALYVAPELRSDVTGHYTSKVDMYSLGIIFFEMCYPLKTGMEREVTIRQLREKDHALPAEFTSSEKAVQGNIIMSLINHRPSERPSSTELLRSGKLPLEIEDETIRQALQGLSDTSSPYYQKMMNALFTQNPNKQIKDYAWDLGIANGAHNQAVNDLVIQGLTRSRLTSIFRRHGAVEIQRQPIFPRSAHYTDPNVVQLLDASGTLVQLPVDLTLPFARAIAKQEPPAAKSFTFGTVYRDTFTGGAPRAISEVDFDIVSYDALDLALKEAEAIKVLDEILDEIPATARAPMCYHVNHSDLLEVVVEFCRISAAQRPQVKETISKLNVQQWTWQKIRNELRLPSIGISATSLDDLARFDFRDTPEKAFAKLRSIFEGTDYLEKTQAIFGHLSTVTSYLKRFGVRRKVYICPLSSVKQMLYQGGVLFQCLSDVKRREVWAAGGRYDKLIEEHKPRVQGHFTGCHAVGFHMGWDRLVTSMKAYQKATPGTARSSFLKKGMEEEFAGQWVCRRCDVLVASFDAAILRTAGVKMLRDLWAHDLSAELAVDARSPEELAAHYKDDKHSWIIIIKHEPNTTGKPDLKIRSLWRKEDHDVRSADLMSFMRGEIRERDQKEGTNERAKLLRQHSHPEGTAEDKKSNVQVLFSQHRSKKSNKWNVVEAAQTRTRALASTFNSSPVIAIETKDDTFDHVRETRLSDPDSWRRVIQGVPLAERQYITQLHDMLLKHAAAWKEVSGVVGGLAQSHGSDEADGGRYVFIYNFRSGAVQLYDLSV